MRRAIELARRGRFSASPNPCVGCVIVKIDPHQPEHYHIIGEGFHLKPGLPHAERVALANCTESPAGATMFVTLEPCCHTGRTPPCTEAIINAGIKRVIVATPDPFAAVNGKGIEILRQHHIQVDIGLEQPAARKLNRYFFHRHETQLPWVILKCAMSLDGKLATQTGESKWITSDAAREHVHQQRAETDAIMAGIGTIQFDNPTLTARPNIHMDDFKPPVRIIIDPTLQIDPQARVIQTIDQAPVWVVCTDQTNIKRKKELERLGVELLTIPAKNKRIDLTFLLKELVNRNVLSVFIEGGPTLHTAFLEQGLVNELLIYMAPKLIGGKEAPNFFMGKGIKTMNDAIVVKEIELLELNPDWLIRGLL